MKTRGAGLFEFGTPWSIEDIEIGEPQEGEVHGARPASVATEAAPESVLV
jgi:Zn-dependent alcohol dehydrogenase